MINDQMGKLEDKMEAIKGGNEKLKERCKEQLTTMKELERKEKLLAKESYSSGRVSVC